MKIALSQLNFIIGDIKGNVQKMILAIQAAIQNKADLIIFSELSICGYSPKDLLDQEGFMDAIDQGIDLLKEWSHHIFIIIGAPKYQQSKQKKKLNTALVLHKGKIIHCVEKTLLPTYDIFDEDRYFESGSNLHIIPINQYKIALTICEDIWNVQPNLEIYNQTPLKHLITFNPDFIINISASPFSYTKETLRLNVLQNNVTQYKKPFIYVNAVGANTGVIFDGQSLALNPDNHMVLRLKSFQEDQQYLYFKKGQFETDETQPINLNKLSTTQIFDPKFNIQHIFEALVLGIKDYFAKMGFSKAILGASGGIDSAVCQALAVSALGKDNVLAVLMPSEFSSPESVQDAIMLSQNLGNRYKIVPINTLYNTFLSALEPHFENLPFGIAEENLQSRIRGNILMALANKFNTILLNTSNKSELATGYGTLYGDMAGGLSVIGDCFKQQVYALAQFINDMSSATIPENILLKAPSAELKPNQKDSDSLPEYPILDAILYYYIDQRMSVKQISNKGYDTALAVKTLELVNRQEYKRQQFCPILRISSKSFGEGRRMPIVARYNF
ncbi:MAG: NAD+ synthase [Alphaproteobacteria bacterium]|nr:NAD+ synthase [Alphaproteobacteria bacterium]